MSMRALRGVGRRAAAAANVRHRKISWRVILCILKRLERARCYKQPVLKRLRVWQQTKGGAVGGGGGDIVTSHQVHISTQLQELKLTGRIKQSVAASIERRIEQASARVTAGLGDRAGRFEGWPW